MAVVIGSVDAMKREAGRDFWMICIGIFQCPTFLLVPSASFNIPPHFEHYRLTCTLSFDVVEAATISSNTACSSWTFKDLPSIPCQPCCP
jgi:hypothetical protein